MEEVSQPFTAMPVATPPVPPPLTAARTPFQVVLLSIWLCGFVGITVSWWIRWRRILATVRSGSPVRLSMPIPTRSSPTLLEPGVFGIYRPVLLLPEGIFERLTPTQLQAVIAHELCHIRCRDNLTAAIHMFVETVFWFHPAVWWIGRRMVEERERACDEEVLHLGSEPQVYAEGILNVCKLYVESPLPCVSGATGSDLKRRIEAIMANRVGHGLTRAKKLLLAIVGIAALAVPVMIGASQAPAEMAPDFVALQDGAGPLPRSTAEVMPMVSLTRNGTIYLNEKPTNIHELGRVIHERFATAKGVYVRADKETIWDALRQVLAVLRQNGFQVNMVTQPEDEGAKGKK
jgi:beta-lactamase regulating signal transducer with metallopeptidase domain